MACRVHDLKLKEEVATFLGVVRMETADWVAGTPGDVVVVAVGGGGGGGGCGVALGRRFR